MNYFDYDTCIYINLGLHQYSLTTGDRNFQFPSPAMACPTPNEQIPKVQTVAMVKKLGEDVVFDNHYPVPVPQFNEVLAKVLYTGVCQSGDLILPESLRSLDSDGLRSTH